MPQEGKPPYHLVNSHINSHVGPFSTILDAVVARTLVNDPGRWNVMDCN